MSEPLTILPARRRLDVLDQELINQFHMLELLASFGGLPSAIFTVGFIGAVAVLYAADY